MSFIQKPYRNQSPRPVKGVTLRLEDLLKSEIPRASSTQPLSQTLKTPPRPKISSDFSSKKTAESSPDLKIRSSSALAHKQGLNQTQPVRMQLNLQDILKTPSPLKEKLSQSLRKVKLNFVSDFLEPETDTHIPSYKDYKSKTPKKREIEKSFKDFSKLHEIKMTPLNISIDSIQDSDPGKKIRKEIQEKFNIKNLDLVPRTHKSRLPSSILVCEGDDIQVFDIQRS
ncbi:unnamed protein product [Blepharisma stoltei]|uniref:Uncharacterized protein n=1 Tax=Blepharisma stoltei TaxID=1481888 RepID=A0AAU9J6G4_9CILI|nr:unnamed protein product [Blepharisma stoltei]